MNEEVQPLYAFDLFRIDPVKRTLWRGAEAVALTSRAFDTLLIFVQNSGRTMPKGELIERVWGATIVEENNLTQCVSVLRKALGEGRADHRFIVTIPGRGYRFVAHVEKLHPGATAALHGRRANDARSGGPAEAPGHITALERDATRAGGADRSALLTAVQNPKSKIQNFRALWLAAAGILLLAAILIFWYAEEGGRKLEATRAGNGTVDTGAYDAYLKDLYIL